jgi:hypothetical protein
MMWILGKLIRIVIRAKSCICEFLKQTRRRKIRMNLLRARNLASTCVLSNSQILHSNQEHVRIGKILQIMVSLHFPDMRTGRPAFHIKAHWITLDLPDGSYFYRLDHRGNLERVNGQIRASRFASAEPAPAAEPQPAPLAQPEQLRAAVSPRRSRPTSVADFAFPDGDFFGGWDELGDFTFAD